MQKKFAVNLQTHIRLIIFNLADIISFERMNGTKVFDDTIILDKDKTANSTWPSTSIVKTYNPVLNKITITDASPLAAPQNIQLSVTSDEYAKITWSANSEPNISGYEIERIESNGWEKIATVTTTSFIDYDVSINPMFLDGISWRVRAKNTSSQYSPYSEIVSTSNGVLHKKNVKNNQQKEKTIEEITTYSTQNYPNPFNPTTQINYQIPKEGHVSLVVYNSLGQEVKTLVNENKGIGNYNVEFNAVNLPSGIYFYKLQSGKFKQVKKILLVK